MVEILCPNGRRFKVKTLPGMTIMDILNEACTKSGFDSNTFDLRHLKKILNVTSMVRFLNLANNAKLEMVKLEMPRKVMDPTIALQIENGSRLTHQFPVKTTLYDVVNYFQNDSKEELFKPGITCVYMRNEYKSEKTLKETSLEAIGITNGRAALRLYYRQDVDIVELTQTQSITANTKNIVVVTDPIAEPIVKKVKLTDSPNKTEKVVDNNLSSPVVNGGEMHFPGPSKQILPENASFGTSSIFTDDKLLQSPKNNMKAPIENKPSNEFANFKFPVKSSTQTLEEQYEIDPLALRQEVLLAMPCERHATIFKLPQHGDEDTTLTGDKGQLDDDFYDVTVEDLRKRMQVLTSAKKTNEDTMMMTKAMKERKEIERAAVFQKVVLRFLLPDKCHVIQGLFRPLETVKVLNDFVRSYIKQEMKSFTLFTTPPKLILKDQNQTLFKAKLCPGANIYISSSNDGILSEKYSDNIQSMEVAQEVLDKYFYTKQSTTSSKTTTTKATTTTKTSYKPPTQRNDDKIENKYNSKPKNAPKWFKVGK